MDEIGGLEAQIEALELTLGDTGAVVAGFDGELQQMRASLAATGTDVAALDKGISRGLRKAFDGLVFDGENLSDALKTLAQSMIDATYRAALKPVTDQVGGLISSAVGGLVGGLLPFADGASFSQGRVRPFASGGVVTGPVTFPMRGGTGLMGEAGPEAIMPLARGADGKLGVRSAGGAPVNVIMNISTPDADGFRRSQGQIATQMSRALGRAQRNR
ncbi:phage tail tape measure protein [Shimia haliotis]|uniref:Phage tail tape measure protein, lambda family n=1 Tax=Shimia haliotis TaxID=1280847 RepID=A0A1I4BE48_9RHOB|nr:phage tail tape measure protein [Shimia haliotis]SFK66570.1 phage tail tape measure protein, lambda family [Shimia haliotis]